MQVEFTGQEAVGGGEGGELQFQHNLTAQDYDDDDLKNLEEIERVREYICVNMNHQYQFHFIFVFTCSFAMILCFVGNA
jgi:hypothetical protein